MSLPDPFYILKKKCYGAKRSIMFLKILISTIFFLIFSYKKFSLCLILENSFVVLIFSILSYSLLYTNFVKYKTQVLIFKIIKK
jgi:hypothetical protein